MIYVLLGLGVVALAWGLLRFLLGAPPATVARTLRWVAIGVLAVFALGLLAAGQWRLAALPGFLILLLVLPLFRRRQATASPPMTAPGDADVGTMTRDQAAEILGVALDATRDEVIAAHARQRALREADGASRWATARLDRARDLLLGEP
jgi:4-amino-4-deoxy-L-arabinose transferase-like glycosyltransferase